MEKERILELLRKVDDVLVQKNQMMTIVIVGYSAVVLSGGDHRGTEDLDALENQHSRLLHRFGIHLLPEHYFHFHPDYRKRLRTVNESFRKLQACYLDLRDVFLLKLDASREKDLQDIHYFIKNGDVHRRDMDSLFEEWRQHWYPLDQELKDIYKRLWKEQHDGSSRG